MPNIRGVEINFGIEFSAKITLIPADGDSKGPELTVAGYTGTNELPTKDAIDKMVWEAIALAAEQMGEEYKLKRPGDLARDFGISLAGLPEWALGPRPTAQLALDVELEDDDPKIGGTSSDDDDDDEDWIEVLPSPESC